MLNWIKIEFNRTYAVDDSQWCALVWHVGSDRFHYINFVCAIILLRKVLNGPIRCTLTSIHVQTCPSMLS
ncbi:unnamed protein product [Chondrus crispus]|uniref:Uncharacterized protein n=1 Tax=Chondrus crispus TaxID=2769 RepID=R7Q598_CHOCR|nr:unnamed protein product [Chondrus crispus]CDF33003.1 unnamed protein product [Chondrus crispus]|eukprot:XP_005712806.1 unnamed protein product [Chondrus crispus]